MFGGILLSLSHLSTSVVQVSVTLVSGGDRLREGEQLALQKWGLSSGWLVQKSTPLTSVCSPSCFYLGASQQMGS